MTLGIRFSSRVSSIPLLLIFVCVNNCHSQTGAQSSVVQLLTKARKGDPDAQYQLGLLYEDGSNETPADQVKAARWFTDLANQGDRRGQNALGIAYMHGYGVSKDEVAGFEWFYKAALNGYAPAQFNLAVAYDRGRGTLKSTQGAFNWFLEAAKNGQSSAQQTLCIQYQKNRLVESDPTMAYAWCLIAKDSGNKHPAIVETYLNRANAMLPTAEVSEARLLASSWISTRKSGGTMPIHSRSFISSAAAAGSVAPRLEIAAPPLPKNLSRVGECESGHWVDSVLSDGEIVKLEDGSIWQIDPGDIVDSSLWLTTDDVTVCGGKLINTDDNSTVGAHRLAQ